jgi:hypothetical protein
MMSEWKPINKFPWDRNERLIAGVNQGRWWVTTGVRNAASSSGFDSSDGCTLVNPTHYMELPPPPSTTVEEK